MFVDRSFPSRTLYRGKNVRCAIFKSSEYDWKINGISVYVFCLTGQPGRWFIGPLMIEHEALMQDIGPMPLKQVWAIVRLKDEQ